MCAARRTKTCLSLVILAYEIANFPIAAPGASTDLSLTKDGVPCARTAGTATLGAPPPPLASDAEKSVVAAAGSPLPAVPALKPAAAAVPGAE